MKKPYPAVVPNTMAEPSPIQSLIDPLLLATILRRKRRADADQKISKEYGLSSIEWYTQVAFQAQKAESRRDHFFDNLHSLPIKYMSKSAPTPNRQGIIRIQYMVLNAIDQ